MSAAQAQEQQVKFSVRYVVNKEKSKVLFAEVGSDFADVLLSFLTLPLGTIVRLLVKHYEQEQAPVINGSLINLYQSVANLDESNFWTALAKRMLLNPRNLLQSQLEKLNLNLDRDTEPTRYFICENWNCSRDFETAYVSLYKDAMWCFCSKSGYNREIKFKDSNTKTFSGDGGVFTRRTASFLISDDLQLKPNLPGSSLQILRSLGIRDANGLEEKTFVFGLKEIMDLLRGSLLSRTPLTDIIFHKRHIVDVSNAAPIKSEEAAAPASDSSRKMTVKAIVQKSTNKILLAQAEDNFVDFLFGLLRIPLGRALFLMGMNPCPAGSSIINLYKSVANLESGKYLKSEAMKYKLLKPQLAPEYPSRNHIFSDLIPRRGPRPPAFYCYSDLSSGPEGGYVGHLTSSKPNGLLCGDERYPPVIFIDLNRKESYVKGPLAFIVTDDLVVMPSSATSSLSILSKLNVPFEDLVEMVFDVGTEEASSILRASLTSTSALTNALLPTLMKQPKQEIN